MAKRSLPFLCGMWVVSAIQLGVAADADRAPNLILIMADDCGAKELACYGHPTHQTPHLDALARDGVRFETCYTACICHPTRFELMTGQYGSTNGVFHFANRAGGPAADARQEQIVNHLTFGTVLQNAGYATAMAGKWQLTGKHPNLVTENGFDEYCMWAYKHNLPNGVRHSGGWEGQAGGRTSRYWHPSIVKNGQYLPTSINDYGPDIFTDFVIDFAGRHREEKFFVYYPMALTHAPYYPTPASTPDRGYKFRNSKAEHFQENVEHLDTLVGRIVAALELLELLENTIILFTSDNGTGREGKGRPTELGARVPMIVSGPGVVSQPDCRALVDTSDVLPTLVELSGASLPAGHPLDGKSFASVLRGDQEGAREWIFSYIGDKRLLRTQRYLLERNSLIQFGQLFDCGTSRDGSGYVDVTASAAPEVMATKRMFSEILATKVVPQIWPTFDLIERLRKRRLTPAHVAETMRVPLREDPAASGPGFVAHVQPATPASPYESVELRAPNGVGSDGSMLIVQLSTDGGIDRRSIIRAYGRKFTATVPPQGTAGVPAYLRYTLPDGELSFGVTPDADARLVSFVLTQNE